MSQIIPTTGKIVDTGVAQESPAHAIMESPAHQRQAYPYILRESLDFEFQYGGASLYVESADGSTASMVNMISDPAYVGLVFWQSDLQATYYDLGTDDDRGYDMTAPVVNPGNMTFTGASAVWSNSTIGGAPYFASSLFAGSDGVVNGPSPAPADEPDGGPFTAWCCGNNVTANWTDNTWYDAGTWTFSLNLQDITCIDRGNGLSGDEFAFIDPYGMQTSFTATLNMGGTIITGNITDGWSGTGVSGNSSDFVGGVGSWTATLTLTFTARWKFSATFGPVDFTLPSALESSIIPHADGGTGPTPTGTFYCGAGLVSISGSN